MKTTVVTQQSVARRLNVHPNTVANMLADGRLVPVTVGTGAGPNRPTRRVDPVSVDRLLAQPENRESSR